MILIVLLFGLWAHADTSDVYAYSGESRVGTAVRFETVPAANETRLAELRAQHQECSLVASGTYRCRCHSCGEGPVAGKVLAETRARLTGKKITLGKPWGPPSLNYRGDSYEEWHIPQAIDFMGLKSDRWRLMKLPSVAKGVIGNPTIDGWVIDREGFLYVSNPRAQESPVVLWTFLIESRFRLSN